MGRPVNTIATVALISTVVSGPGCSCPPSGGTAELSGQQASDHPLPRYAEIARRYNEHVDRLDRIWARTVIRVSFPNEEGEQQTEQGEGHLQMVRPSRLALSLGKIGETFFYLGSNDEVYWWFDLRKQKRAWVGEHAAAARRTVRGGESSGEIPIHPLDVVDLLSVTPLPTGDGSTTPIVEVGWNDGGTALSVLVPARLGFRRLLLDPETMLATSIELLDAEANMVMVSELSDYQRVTVRGDATVAPQLPGVAVISIPESRTEIRLRIHDPENRSDKPKETPFNLARLLEAYGIEEVIRLDREQAIGGH